MIDLIISGVIITLTILYLLIFKRKKSLIFILLIRLLKILVFQLYINAPIPDIDNINTIILARNIIDILIYITITGLSIRILWKGRRKKQIT